MCVCWLPSRSSVVYTRSLSFTDQEEQVNRTQQGHPDIAFCPTGLPRICRERFRCCTSSREGFHTGSTCRDTRLGGGKLQRARHGQG
ncbi:hypothetical protein DPMN_074536 [Dreissena polymorpha]|uniref:Uncharacterized protein n=1 Tax=Dreissena polymorpha TaxID=45954 RepID=A0A9D3YIU7_DREPO|nr:hypothetical protein DPMN_074536 [Dreissena polymorpha]